MITFGIKLRVGIWFGQTFDVPWLTCVKHIVEEVIEKVSDKNVTVSVGVNKNVSLSDHEAVTSHLYLWKSLLT